MALPPKGPAHAVTDLIAPSDVREAKERAARIRVGMVTYLTTLADIRSAWDRQDWATLGYDDWDAYLDGEFSEVRLRVPAEHRQKAIAELRMAGMSTRAIASATDLSQATVAREVRELSHMTQLEQPDRIKGLDGKERPAIQSHREQTSAELPTSTDGADDKPDPSPCPLLPVEVEEAEAAGLVVRPESPAATPVPAGPALPWPVAEDIPRRPETPDPRAHAARVSDDVRRLITLAQTFGSAELRARAVDLYSDDLGHAPMPPSGAVNAGEIRAAAESIHALAKDWKKKR